MVFEKIGVRLIGDNAAAIYIDRPGLCQKQNPDPVHANNAKAPGGRRSKSEKTKKVARTGIAAVAYLFYQLLELVKTAGRHDQEAFQSQHKNV